MVQPSKWWWGLIPLAVIWVLANWVRIGPIKADLEARSQAVASAVAKATPGVRPVTTIVSGRDVTLGGEVLELASGAATAKAVDDSFGIRRVHSGVAQAVAIKPYLWSATRDASKITLSGLVPDETVRKANLEAATKAFPGLAVEDAQTIGFGAPPAFAAVTAWVLPELARLRDGVATLSDTALSLNGNGPVDYAACSSLSAQARSVPAGVTLSRLVISCPPPPAPPAVAAPVASPVPLSPPVAAALPAPVAPPAVPSPVAPPTSGVVSAPPASPVASPPVEVPVAQVPLDVRIDPPDLPDAPPPPSAPPVALEWSAVKSAGGIALSGMAPGDAARTLARTTAAGSATGPVMDDAVRLVGLLKEPPDYALATQFALGQLRALSTGEVRLKDTSLEITGAAPTPAVKASIELALRGRLPGGLSSAMGSITVRPYVFQARIEKGTLILEGLVPDLETRNAMLAITEASPFRGKVTDTLVIVGGAPDGMADTARLALQSLLRMDEGAARIVDNAVTFYGTTCKAGVKDLVETVLKVNLANGFTSSALVDVRKAAECGSCTQDLAKIEGRAIMFQQGKAEVAADPATAAIIDQLAAILKTCPASKIEIVAHTNNDGEARGFDNLALSESRAGAVLAALVQRGILASQLQAVGRGSTRPVQPHGTPGAREQNRRIDFNVKITQ